MCVSVVTGPMLERSSLQGADADLVRRLQVPRCSRGCRLRSPTPSPRLTLNHENAATTSATAMAANTAISARTTRRIRPARRSARLAQRMASPTNRTRIQPAPNGGPHRGVRQEDDDRDAGDRQPDQRPRTVAPVGEHLLGERLLLALVRHDECRDEVDEDPGSAEEGQDHEAEAEEVRVQVEVPAETAGDAGRVSGRMCCARGAELLLCV